jgi:hypothetical protein
LAGASKIYSTLFSGIYTPPMLHITIIFVKSKKLRKNDNLPDTCHAGAKWRAGIARTHSSPLQ